MSMMAGQEGHNGHAGSGDRRARVQWYSEKLLFDGTQPSGDLDFADPTREVIHAGPLFRQKDPLKLSVNGWKELWVVLFDNYLILAKPKSKGNEMRYVVWKPPVRVELLVLSGLTIRPVQRSNTFSRMMRTGRDSPDLAALFSSSPSDSSSSPSEGNTFYPLSFHALGKNEGAYTLYARTPDERNEWRRKLKEAIAARKAVLEERSVFMLQTITDDTGPSQDAPAHHTGLVTGRILCSLPFSSRDGRNLVAIGSEDGVWIGMQGQPELFQRVISLRLVTQLAFLEESGILLILADRVLYSIGIESIVVSPGRTGHHPTAGLQRLSGQDKQVHYFSVGRQSGRTLVVTKTRRGLDSVFSVLELRHQLDLNAGHRINQFTVFKDFFLPSESYDILFLRTKVCVLCPRGFEIMDLSDLSSVTIPQDDDMRRLGKRPLISKPIAMFRIREDEFLLCYDEFGLYVDKRGTPSRSPPTLEWEGVASHAAWHPPYVLLFGPSFIEIRHVESGRLAQIIQGHDIHCIWDGRGVIRADGADDFDDPRTPRIHVVLDDSEMAGAFLARHQGSHTPPKRQHAVVLAPTERLIVPGTRYSPSLLSVADTLPAYVP